MTDRTPSGYGSLKIRVRDADDQPVGKATVELKSVAAGSTIQLTYDERLSIYSALSTSVGEYLLQVKRQGFESQERAVTIVEGANEEIVILGKNGMRYYFRGKAKVPFEPRPDLVAVILRRQDDKALKELADAAKRLKLREFKDIPEPARDAGGRVFSIGGKKINQALKALDEVDVVAHAGAIVGLHERSISFLTNELMIVWRREMSEAEVRTRISQLGLSVLRKVPYLKNTFHVASSGPATYELLDIADRTAKWDDVDFVEPNLVTTVELDQVNPTDFLWPGVWDRQLVNTPGAWKHLKECGIYPFGSSEIVIAFVDQGIESIGGVPTHPDFQGEVADGSSKVYRLYDFNTLVPNNDSVLGNHGMGVSGVGAAKANNDSVIAGQDEGIAGAAPNCRAMGLIFPFTESEQLDMYVWAAGFDPGSPLAGFPDPISKGADVFSTSIGFGSGAPISATAAGTFDFLVTNGRGGRGCLLFFSAGNAAIDFTTFRPWAAYENTFGMAASTLDNDGASEIRAPYSGFGPAELCAPSHDEFVPGGALHNPPANYATWSADLVGQGNLVGHAGVQTILTAAAAAGDTQLTVADANNFVNGAQVLVGLPGTPGSEPTTIAGAPNIAAGTIPITALMNPHPAGVTVVSGANDYRNNFGGTSSATPLAAGVAALVLSAYPGMTFVQARKIMRDTAVKIDPNNADPIGQWLDEDNNPSNITGKPPVFSQWFGYGRVNAKAAVKVAAKMKPKKPETKTTYRYAVKVVCGKSCGDILAKGRYFTAINIHNPSEKTATIRKKISLALPGETPGHLINAGRAKLRSCQSFEIDCADIYEQAKLTECCFIKGFVILESTVPLEIVAVYSAAGADKQVETIHTERVTGHKVKKVIRKKDKSRIAVKGLLQIAR
ncbi:MAG: S8 family serine peptidase [Gammaproteobacteria bacterium]